MLKTKVYEEEKSTAKVLDIKTHPDWWDCECETKYIHPKPGEPGLAQYYYSKKKLQT